MRNPSNASRLKRRPYFGALSSGIVATLLAMATPAAAEKLEVSMVTATSIADTLPFEVFRGKEFRAEKGSRFVKLHMYFDSPVLLKAAEVESCGEAFTSKTTFYLNFDEKVKTVKPRKANAKVLRHAYKEAVKARSLTINFKKNVDLCIKRVTFFGQDDKPIEVVTPKIVRGTYEATDTLLPLSSYGPSKLFDSRYEFAWATDGKATGGMLTFRFDEVQSVEALRIWNGYQRSTIHCQANSRVQALKVEGEGGYSVTVPVKDEYGPQLLELPKPYKGKELRITVDKAFKGKKYKDLLISELRFFGDGRWFMFDPLSEMKTTRDANIAAMKGAGLGDVLGRSFVGYIKYEESKTPTEVNGDWTLRLRTDGSFFIEGSTHTSNYATEKGTSETFFALGNYEIKKKKKNRVDVSVYGFLRKFKERYAMEMDCNGCGRDCTNKRPDGSREAIFNDRLVIKRNKKGELIVQNVGRRRSLNFKTLVMKEER